MIEFHLRLLAFAGLLVALVLVLPRRWRDVALVGGFVLLVVLPVFEIGGPRLNLPVLAVAEPTPAAAETDGSLPPLGVLALLLSLGGSIALLLRHLVRTRRLWQWIRSQSHPANHELRQALARAGRQLGIAGKRLPEIRTTRDTRLAPALAGLRRPVVLVPDESRQWSRRQLDAVLLHELAHLRRGDLWKDFAFSLVVALYWWNPFVWMLRRLHREEREIGCDRAVVDSGCPAAVYARILLEFAARPTAPALLAMAGREQPGRLEARIGQLLGNQSKRLPLVLATTAGLAVGTLAFAAFAVDLVAGDPDPTSMEREVDLRLSADPFPGD